MKITRAQKREMLWGALAFAIASTLVRSGGPAKLWRDLLIVLGF